MKKVGILLVFLVLKASALNAFQLFDFKLGNKIEENIKSAMQKGLVQVEKNDQYIVFEGKHLENSEVNIRLIFSLKDMFVYGIDIYFISGSIEKILPYYNEIRSTAKNDVFDLDRYFYNVEDKKIPSGFLFKKNNIYLSLKKYQNDKNEFIIGMKLWNKILENEYSDIDKVYEMYTKKWFIFPKKQFSPKLPKSIYGQKVYWPKEDPNIEDAQLINSISPKYFGYEGLVSLIGIIDIEGNVSHLEVNNSDLYLLNEPSLKAVRQWKFKPAKLNGKPIYLIFTVDYFFKKDDGN